jgi:beta-lactamase superfamily II metal-dependent hydrolase
MKVKFLNVGHGDSIVLEWYCADNIKVGIVDCKKHNGKVPTIEYLRNGQPKEIEILILSHPHIDHYSGFIELLEYIETNNIKIKCFAHTLFGDPKYLNWTESKTEDRKNLESIITKVEDFKDNKNIIEDIEWPIQNWRYHLDDDYCLKALSPSDSEIRTRKAKINYYKKENRFLCSSSSNYLSSVLLLSNIKTKKHFLLTSDAVDITFERLHKSKAIPEEIALSGIQVPHHGSSKSMYEKFWSSLDYDFDKEANISAGLNSKYNLPDYEVVSFLDKIGLKQDITNYINGFKDYFDRYNQNTLKVANALDDDSEIVTEEFLAKEFISTEI